MILSFIFYQIFVIMSRNIFAQMGADDSDEEYEAKPMTKTQKKKEEKKVVEKEAV